MKPKGRHISVRVSEELKSRLQQAEAKTGIDEAVLVRCCAEALVDYIEAHGEITIPLIVKPKSAEDAERKTKYRPDRSEHDEALMEDKAHPPKRTKAA